MNIIRTKEKYPFLIMVLQSVLVLWLSKYGDENLQICLFLYNVSMTVAMCWCNLYVAHAV